MSLALFILNSTFQVKREEFDIIRIDVQQYLESIEDEQKRDVNEKIVQLLKNFNDLSNVLMSRIPIIELFYKFHQEAEHLSNLFNNFEHSVKTQKNSDVFHYIDTVWEKIQAQFSLLKTLAKLFASEKTKVCLLTRFPAVATACVQLTRIITVVIVSRAEKY